MLDVFMGNAATVEGRGTYSCVPLRGQKRCIQLHAVAHNSKEPATTGPIWGHGYFYAPG